MSDPNAEDPLTPPRRPAPQGPSFEGERPRTPAPPGAPDPALLAAEAGRDRAVLRPVLDSGSDATVELPRGRPAGPSLRTAPSALAIALPVGSRLHEYRIDGVLGEGGFGITYLATDVHLNAAVAIKEYFPQDIVFRAADGSVSPTASEHLPRYRQGLDSFLVEARTLASFRHRAIVRVARFFEALGTAYMVLEVENGSPLKLWWPHRRQLGEKALVELLLPLLDGLAAMHKAGFLHRDIKPDNIQVRASDGSFVLLDFGSAGQTAGVATHGLVVVTPGYAPFEQYGPGEQGPWTDLYALGATLYWAVSGRKPPDAETRRADPRAHSRAVEAGRDVYGDAFLKAIDWALNTDPAKRPRTVADFRRALCADHPASLQRFEASRRRGQRAGTGAEGSDESAPFERRGPARPRWLRLLLPRHWPLAATMAVVMGVAAVLPMVAVSWANLRGSAAALGAAESRYLQQVAVQSAADVSGLLGESRRLARLLATDPAVVSWLDRPTEPLRLLLRDELQRLAQATTGVQAVILLDAAGTAVFGTGAQGAGASHALRPWFRVPLSGKGYSSSLWSDASPGGSSLYAAEPVRAEGGAVAGVLVVRVSGEEVTRRLDAAGQDKRLTPMLVDGDGVLLYHPHADLRLRSLMPLSAERQAALRSDQRFRRDEVTSLGESALAKALTGTQAPGALAYASAVSGMDVVTAYAPVAGHDWVVAVSEDRSTLQSPLGPLKAWLLAGALGVTGLMTGVAWWFSRRLVRPIREATRALQEMKNGDYEDARVRADGGGEIAQLGRAVNALSEHLSLGDRDRDRARDPGPDSQRPPPAGGNRTAPAGGNRTAPAGGDSTASAGGDTPAPAGGDTPASAGGDTPAPAGGNTPA